jgi:hypothetical protein
MNMFGWGGKKSGTAEEKKRSSPRRGGQDNR